MNKIEVGMVLRDSELRVKDLGLLSRCNVLPWLLVVVHIEPVELHTLDSCTVWGVLYANEAVLRCLDHLPSLTAHSPSLLQVAGAGSSDFVLSPQSGRCQWGLSGQGMRVWIYGGILVLQMPDETSGVPKGKRKTEGVSQTVLLWTRTHPLRTFNFFFFSAGVQIHSLMHARQVFYHWATYPQEI
jgi:hypothetical protein